MSGEFKIKIDRGGDQDRAREEVVDFLNKIAEKYLLNYYELLGIIDVVTMDIHLTANEEEE